MKRYWLKGQKVLCEARVAEEQAAEWEDFDQDFLADEEKITRHIKRSVPYWWYLNEVQYLNLYNTLAIELICNLVYKKVRSFDWYPKI